MGLGGYSEPVPCPAEGTTPLCVDVPRNAFDPNSLILFLFDDLYRLYLTA